MSNLPPPPPKRTVPALPSSGGSSASASSSSIWSKTIAGATTGWNGLYKVADMAGSFTNKQAAKLGTEAFYPTSLDIECDKAARILRTFTMDAAERPQEALANIKKTQAVIRKIPPSAIAKAHGLAIFTVMRTGFLISGAGGSGIVMARLEDGTWSAPSGILLHTLGVGFLAGIDVYDCVLLLRNSKAVNTFIRPRVTLGGEIAISAGPVGNGVMLEAGIEASPVWSYTKSKGLYAGLQLDGNILIERVDENARAYHRSIKASEILAGEVKPPYWTSGLHNTIAAAEGKEHRLSMIPTGLSPSQLSTTPPPARRLPPTEFDEDDLRVKAEMEEALRSFGIEDPTINDQLRKEDPLLLRTGEGLEILSSPEGSLEGSPPVETGSSASSVYFNGGAESNASGEKGKGRETGSEDDTHAQEERHRPVPPPLPPRHVDHTLSPSISDPAFASDSKHPESDTVVETEVPAPATLSPTTSGVDSILTEAVEMPPPTTPVAALSREEVPAPAYEEVAGEEGAAGEDGVRSGDDKPPIPPRRSPVVEQKEDAKERVESGEKSTEAGELEEAGTDGEEFVEAEGGEESKLEAGKTEKKE